MQVEQELKKMMTQGKSIKSPLPFGGEFEMKQPYQIHELFTFLAVKIDKLYDLLLMYAKELGKEKEKVWEELKQIEGHCKNIDINKDEIWQEIINIKDKKWNQTNPKTKKKSIKESSVMKK